MDDTYKIKELEDKLQKTEKTLNDKNVILEKIQNSKLKLFIILLLFGPIFQFIPLRKGSLIKNYGFPNGLIYFYIGCAIVIPIAYLLTIKNMYREIDQIENDIEMLQKRIEILKK